MIKNISWLKSKSKRVYLQSALGHINASGRGKAVLRRSQAVFKCLQWWGTNSFLAEGIPVKHSTSKKWIFGSVMTRPGSSNFFIVVVPHEPIGTRSKTVAGDGYKTMFDLVGHHQPGLSPPLCQIRPAQLPKHGRRTSWAIPPAFFKNNFGHPGDLPSPACWCHVCGGGPTQWSSSLSRISQVLGKPAPWSAWGALEVPLDEVQPGVSLFTSSSILHSPAEILWKPDSQVLGVRQRKQHCVTQFIKIWHFGGLSSANVHDVALLRIEPHTPQLGPPLKCIKITLQDELVLQWVYWPV